MTADHRQHYLEGVRTGLSAVVYPLYYVINLPMVAGGWIGTNFTTHQALKAENNRLYSEHVLLKAQVQTLAALDAENHRLRTLLKAAAKVNERVSVADIVAVDVDPYARKLVLNKGVREGVYEGQPLIDSDGVMGQVIELSVLSSVAMLITDTGHSLPVMLNRTGLRAIAVGVGSSGELDLPYLPNSTDIKKGDLLVTSGLDGRFPPNYPAAIVIYAEKMSGQPFMRVRAAPAAHLDHNREVLLVWRAPPAPLVQKSAPALQKNAPALPAPAASAVTQCDPTQQKCAAQGSASATQGRTPGVAAAQGSASATQGRTPGVAAAPETPKTVEGRVMQEHPTALPRKVEEATGSASPAVAVPPSVPVPASPPAVVPVQPAPAVNR